jgi:hypothetical protein
MMICCFLQLMEDNNGNDSGSSGVLSGDRVLDGGGGVFDGGVLDGGGAVFDKAGSALAVLVTAGCCVTAICIKCSADKQITTTAVAAAEAAARRRQQQRQRR